MDKRKKMVAVFDVETAGLTDIYDIGLVVADKQGKIYHSKQWLIKEVWEDVEKMAEAYYWDKYPIYDNLIREELVEVVPFAQMRKEFNEILDTYNVSLISAYNLNFDKRAVETGMEKFGGGGKFLQRPMEILCIWGMFCETVGQQKTFKNLARKLGWVTKKGNIRTSAEVAYRYISGNFMAEEEHTGLSDCIIETAILTRCFQQHKKYTHGIAGRNWQLVQE